MSMIYKINFKLVLLWSLGGILFNVLRLSAPNIGLDQYVVGSFANIINSVFFITFIAILSVQIVFKKKIDKVIMLTLMLVCYGLFIGFANENEGEKWKHSYIFVLGTVFILFGVNFYQYLTKALMKKFIYIGLYFNVLASFLYLFLSSVFFMYPGYGTQSIGYVLLYFLVFKQRLLLSVSFFLVIAQGKRSIFFSCVACMFLYYVYRLSGRSTRVLVLFVVLMPVVAMSLLYFLHLLEQYDISGLNRIALINPFSDKYDLYIGSSGRFDEYLSAFKEFSKNKLNYIFGSGFGFSFEWVLSYREDEIQEVKGYVHNGPLFFIYLLGPFITIILYSFLTRIVVVPLNKIRKNRDEDYKKMITYISFSGMFFLISGFFSLNIISDLLGWIFIGLSLGYLRKESEHQVKL